MVQRKTFTMIDFYESISTIHKAIVDFDNTSPVCTQQLTDWANVWIPHLLAKSDKEIERYCQALPSEDGKGLLLALPDDGEVVYLPCVFEQTEVLFALSVLICLCCCQSFRSVLNVLHHFKTDEIFVEHPDITYDEFTALRRELFQLLREDDE